MSLLHKGRMAWGIVRNHGPRWTAARLFLEAQKRAGWEARIFPPRSWRADEWRFWVIPALQKATAEQLLAAWLESSGSAWGRSRRGSPWEESLTKVLTPFTRQSLITSADEILAGRFTLFSRHKVDAGFPPKWLCNPMMDSASVPSAEKHWSRLPMRGEPYGDLKFVWELSRFSWAFTLARTFAVTKDERYAEGFWRLWLDWMDANPPNSTANWKCGQECSLRLFAVSFAVEVLANAAATTPERFARHVGTIGTLADRVARGGWYARLQNNNHSISEAAGLYTIGVLFPQLTDAAHWRAEGWSNLAIEAARLLRSDGTFSQNSNNYQRLMLHDYLWAASIAHTAGEVFAPNTMERLRCAAAYLRDIVDTDTGSAPNFGANDGALILPLEEAAYTDYRPAATASHYLATGKRIFPGDTGGETLLWLFGPDALAAPLETSALTSPQSFPEGGIYILRQKNSALFAHAQYCHTRPGHAGQLHVDLWWRGFNIARDAGTYLYYGPRELYEWFDGTACHNTVCVDGLDQMERGPRFLWARWANGTANFIPSPASQDSKILDMSHDGYARLSPPVSVRRRVHALANDSWLVIDDLDSTGTHDYRLHWLLADCPWRREGEDMLILETPRGPYAVECGVIDDPSTQWQMFRAVEGMPAWGWESLHYGERTPALSLVLQSRASRVRFATFFSPAPAQGTLLDKVHAAGY